METSTGTLLSIQRHHFKNYSFGDSVLPHSFDYKYLLNNPLTLSMIRFTHSASKLLDIKIVTVSTTYADKLKQPKADI